MNRATAGLRFSCVDTAMTESVSEPDSLRSGHYFWIVVLIGLAGTLAAAICVAVAPFPVRVADTLVYDTLSAWSLEPAANTDVTIVDIDDRSLTAVGQWPWPRYRIAMLVDAVSEANPASIGLDILFAEKDETSLASMRERFRRDFGLDIGFTGIPPGLTDNDGYLGHVLSRIPAVGSVYFTFDDEAAESSCTLHPLQTEGDFSQLDLPVAKGVLCNTPPIQQGLTDSGFINHLPDPDGRLRGLPMLIRYDDGSLHPSFSLALLMRQQNTHSVTLHNDLYGPVLKAGAAAIPITRNGEALLSFYGAAGTIRTIPALDIMAGSFDPHALQGRHVIIGSSAAGLNDLHHTIADAQLSGAETQATFIANALSGSLRRIPGWSTTYSVLATVAVGVFITLLFALTAPPYAALGAFLTALFFLGLTSIFLTTKHVYMPATGPVAVAFALLMALSTILYILENRRSLMRLVRLVRAQRLTLSSMAAVTETRDPDTGGHIQRTQKYVRLLAEQLAREGKHGITDEYIELLYLSAPLHDVGKVGMPDSILLKPGRLTPDEFDLMKKHAEHGHAIMETAEEEQGEDGGFLSLAKEIALTHHERWDGSGYPKGLAGTDIPLSGRLMALADVYDALVSSRLYKDPYSHEEARTIIIEGSGKHFDPDIVDAFLAREQEFIRIANEDEAAAT